MKHIFLFFLSVFVYTLTYAQPGMLDPSFGDRGKVLSTTLFYGYETALGVQRDGRIIIGSKGKYKGFTTFKVTSFLPDGSIDNSFGENGSAYALFPYFQDTIRDYAFITSLSITKEGKIVVTGYTVVDRDTLITERYPMARFLSNGSLDSSFGSNGVSADNPDFGLINTLVTQDDGKIIIGGSTSSNDADLDFRSFVARYNEDGSIDKGFGEGGIAINKNGREINALAVQPDGYIVACGYNGLTRYTSGNKGILERLTPGGQLDETFGSAGIIKDGNSSALNSITLQPDGRIVAAGFNGNYGNGFWTVLRYTARGSLDLSFGNDGKITTSFPNAYSTAKAVFVSGSHIVTVGTTTDGLTTSDFALAGYNMDGSLDKSFGKNGITTTDLQTYADQFSAAQQPDGKILQLGVVFPADESTTTGVLLRYMGYPQQVPLAVRIRRWLQNHGISWKGLPVEDKVSYYSVEQSGDGKDFAQIARVSGAANLKDYSVTNSHLLDGINYYRIKAVSNDGTVRYSEVVSADNTANTASVFPNPARSYVTVQGLKDSETASIAIKDAAGTVLARGVSGGGTQYRSSVGNLQPGTYYLDITTKNKTETLKFVKE